MRKKLMNYIIKETKNKKLFSTVIEPTLEECYFLYNSNNIFVTRARSKVIYPITNNVSLIDTINFCKEWFKEENMKTRKDWLLYIKLCILLGLVALISFEGTVIASLAYLLAYDIVNNK